MLDPFKFATFFTTIAGVLFLCNCGQKYSETIEVVRVPGYMQSHGPFDSNGAYIERWADKPPRRIFVDKKNSANTKPPTNSSTLPRETTKPYSPPKPTETNRNYRSAQPYVAPRVPLNQPQAQVIKPLTKAPIRHRVSSTDTLYGLSRRYGVSVSSIQRANGLRGTTIITGSTILIPR